MCYTLGTMPQRKNRKAKSKERKITPTLRQQIAVKKLAEIVRNSKGKRVTIGKILRESGYSESVSKSPTRVTKSKGWDKLMEEYFPDDALAAVEGGQLRASHVQHYVFPASESNKSIRKTIESFPNCRVVEIKLQHSWKRAYFYAPDNAAVGKSLDRIYKLKKKYPTKDDEGSGDRVLIIERGWRVEKGDRDRG